MGCNIKQLVTTSSLSSPLWFCIVHLQSRLRKHSLADLTRAVLSSSQCGVGELGRWRAECVRGAGGEDGKAAEGGGGFQCGRHIVCVRVVWW